MNNLKTLTIGNATILIIFSAACSTTTIQTGGTQYRGPEHQQRYNQKEKQPESTFFNEMSSKDEAFRDKPKEEIVQKREYQDTAIIDREAVEREKMDEKRPMDYNNDAVTNNSNDDYELDGVSSWYGRDFDGKPTASGVIFDSRKLTAAHKKIPLGSIALIKNTENDKEVLVTINDRGPFIKGRILDVSEYSAELLGFKEQGLTNVQIKIVRLGKGKVSNKGATYEFFGPESGYERNVGAGDDAQANAKIDEMLDREEENNKQNLSQTDTIKSENEQTGYAIQIGIFTDKRNALELQNHINESAQYNHVATVYKRGALFTVKIGSFSTRDKARDLKIKLIKEGYRAFISAPKNDMH